MACGDCAPMLLALRLSGGRVVRRLASASWEALGEAKRSREHGLADDSPLHTLISTLPPLPALTPHHCTVAGVCVLVGVRVDDRGEDWAAPPPLAPTHRPAPTATHKHTLSTKPTTQASCVRV